METTLHGSETFNKNDNAQNSIKANLKNNKKKSWSKLKCVKVVYKIQNPTLVFVNTDWIGFYKKPNGSAIQSKFDLNEFVNAPI
ncbi:uncharacterized protein OCT59_008684 [Rhizophagus irregularis]|uniref:uncharacterized protein n=1 Tax=Rhizophagus irregularis TaxID=588596 RepID=UPI0019F1D0FB|nr:hypothetical protein OCT59_008684 [Rhizophagus irregularis]GET61218.1 hypothetical protein RIR_jg22147.t1 [Rhizophagus irregularis DAOM 181602=DAOM 197198]CAG8563857.1 5698_t:CDS:2 [Rhizophagus irregularis]